MKQTIFEEPQSESSFLKPFPCCSNKTKLHCLPLFLFSFGLFVLLFRYHICVVHIYCCNLGVFKTPFPCGPLQKAPAHLGFTVEVESESL